MIDLSLRRHHLRLVHPLVTAAGTIRDRDVWVLRLCDGVVQGFGEAAPLPGFGGGDVAKTAAILTAAPVRLTEAAIPELVAAWRDPTTSTAARALETAMVDLTARRVGIPLFRHLGGRGEGVVPTAVLLDDQEARHTTDDERKMTFKIKSTGDVVADLARLRRLAIRHPGCRLRLDANASWSEDDGMRFVETADCLPLDFVEQPLPAENLDGHARLLRAGLPVALDEGLAGVDDPADIAHCCSVCVIKSQWWATEPGPWIATARGRGLRVIISDVLGSAVGRAHAGHLAAALVADEVHGLGTDHLIEEDLAPLRAHHGRIRLPAGPGLGLDLTDA